MAQPVLPMSRDPLLPISGLRAGEPIPSEHARFYAGQLEHGRILYFERAPFAPDDTDRAILLGQRQTSSALHKNISYRPASDVLRGVERGGAGAAQLKGVMRRFVERVTAFVDTLLRPYAAHRQLDYASFRPLEEAGRKLSLHKRNDLLHVDAFPSRPTRGGRILRVFTNINPAAERVWLTGEPVHVMAPMLAPSAELSQYARPSFASRIASVLSGEWFGRRRCAYDRFMLHFHDWLKENTDFQRTQTTGARHSRRDRDGWCSPMAFRTPSSAANMRWNRPISCLVERWSPPMSRLSTFWRNSRERRWRKHVARSPFLVSRALLHGSKLLFPKNYCVNQKRQMPRFARHDTILGVNSGDASSGWTVAVMRPIFPAYVELVTGNG